MKVLCQICKHHIANLDKSAKAPMQGSMFLSPDEHHGVPAPFNPVLTWEHMYCPMCQKRPFFEDNIVLTNEGLVDLTNEGLVDLTADKVEEQKPVISHPAIAMTLPHIEAPAEVPEPQGDPVPAQPDEMKPEAIRAEFERMIKSGEIVAKGSWFQYKGENRRKSELFTMIKNGE